MLLKSMSSPTPASASARDAAVKRRVESLIAEICESLVNRLPARPKAIVLTGSFARDEGSVLLARDHIRVLGDMEYMVVFSPGSDRGVLQKVLDEQAVQLREELFSRGLYCDLEFRATYPEYFQHLSPQIFGYELLSRGRTVWGDSSVLATAPRFPVEAIPRWDAWRMLNNRIVEQLYWVDRITVSDRDELLRLYYQLIKCHIDLCTTLLVFAGKYEDTYAGRSAALTRWASGMSPGPAVEFLSVVARKVAACTAFKLDPNGAEPPLGVRVHSDDAEVLRDDLRRALLSLTPLVEEVWCWEAAEFVRRNHDSPTPRHALLLEVLREQPITEKLRGWAKLMLMPAVRGQKGFMNRLGKLLLKGSPRYLVYGVAADLYFQVPAVLSGTVDEQRLAVSEALLPVTFAANQKESRFWWRLRADVLDSWHIFLRTHWA
ncbi:MAG: hypothetical protein ACYDD2_02560 [Candidatus Acidiferrales bacterium]